MDVIFKTITYKNILSVGAKPITIDLHTSMKTLITGKNGFGKSTMIEALTFLLYGKAFRKIKKDQLVNSINGKALLVEGEFSVGKNEYTVKRGIKPNVFEITKNGEKVPELASATEFQKYFEEDLLGVKYDSFKQIIVLGTAGYTPFMELPAAARRELVEDLLDLKIIGQMDRLNKQALKLVSGEMDTLDAKVESNQREQDTVQRGIDAQKAQTDGLIKTRTAQVVELVTQIKALKDQVESVQRLLDYDQEPAFEPFQLQIDKFIADNSATDIEAKIQELVEQEAVLGDTRLGKFEALDRWHDDEIRRLTVELNAVTKPARLDCPPAPLLFRLAVGEKPEFGTIDADIQRANDELVGAQHDLSHVLKAIDAASSGGICSSCGTDLSTVDTTDMERRLPELSGIVAELTEELRQLRADRAKIVVAIEHWQAEVDEDEKLVRDYETEMVRWESTCSRLNASYDHAVAQYHRELEQAQNRLDGVPVQHQQKLVSIENEFNSASLKLSTEIAGLKQQINELDSKIEAYKQEQNFVYQSAVRQYNERTTQYKNSIELSNQKIQMLTDQAKSLKIEVDELKNTEYDTSEIDELKSKYFDMIQVRTKLFNEKRHRGVIVDMLKDTGIKAAIVKQYIPVFNKKINQYLTAMGADYNFALDDTFNETIKSRDRTQFTYTSFSQGERARINIALLFTWRDIASLVSGTNINLLILDELFDSATDAEGVQCMNKLLSDSGSNVMVISHRIENIDDSFDRHIKMVKKGRFSSMEID